MATIVEVENSKMECLSDYLEKMLKYGGKAMSYLEKLKEESEDDEDEELEHKKIRKRRSMKDYDDDEYLRYY